MTKEEKEILFGAEFKNIKNEFPAEMVEEIFSQEGQKEYDFVGYMNLYKMVSDVVDQRAIIVDIGCYLAPQCYLFKNHLGYIGVDDCQLKRFTCDNSEHYYGDVRQFLNDYKFDYMTDEQKAKYFIVCAYDINIFILNRILKTFGEDKVLVCYPN